MSKQVGKQGESNLILEPEQFSNSFFNSQQSSSSNPKLPTISRKDRHMDLIKKRYAKNKDVAEYLRSYDFIKRAEELSIIYLFERDSSSTKLQIPLTTDEQILVKKFCDEMIKGITEHDEQESVLKYMERIIEGYLNQGIRLNSYYGKDNKTVTNFIFEKMEELINRFHANPHNSTTKNIIQKITRNLVLKGGVEKGLSFYSDIEGGYYGSNYLNDLNEQCKSKKKMLEGLAYEGIVKENNKQIDKYDLEVEVDNKYFYIKYPQGSIVEIARTLNNEKAKDLEVGIFQIEENIVKVEITEDGKRNYTDILKGGIEIFFTTKIGEISIYLRKDGNKMVVEIDEKSKIRFSKLENKSSFGGNCLIQGKSVLEVMGKSFENIPEELTQTIKNVPSTSLMQTCLQQQENSNRELN
ncbi:hypothetical protein C1A_484 [Wolbachia endosymbiont of Culex quinquefasciatus JHB]|uniref:Jg24799 protein n=5 Tax=cellular organisms TaxID=131567 RepID=A0A8S4QF44_9NEOP|nr:MULTISPECIES: hypothetical protein [unclassified Wolbachia]CAH2209304.1 jg24799 [Pararge aegeria aegeria]EEB56302.1 hypothetical protein C1A_484 [Wolbachia endosymbiont of Culex quinquefasciatus JHB]MBS9531511.1 hypothetical protein [Wolbachia endosymbiont of Rhagoletis cerasi]QEK89540.1 hypothetical protein CAI20_02250 [Wolbachia endosymbiont of Chrysomya megacephala]CAQ55028.1 hypothetical protein WP0920 [Wolbachia endosymbiont of Culex quinquefasciatus Pel]